MGCWGASVSSMLPTALPSCLLGGIQPTRIHPIPVCILMSPQPGRSHSRSPFFFQQRVQQDGGRGISEVLRLHGDEPGPGPQVRQSECSHVHASRPPERVPADRALCSSSPPQRSAGAGRPHSLGSIPKAVSQPHKHKGSSLVLAPQSGSPRAGFPGPEPRSNSC